jgi:vacuolar protein-sorting-associated protein 4
VKQASEVDQPGNEAEALRLYKQALEYLLTGLKYERNAKIKDVIRERCRSYMARAEELKEILYPESRANTEEEAIPRASLAGTAETTPLKRSDDLAPSKRIATPRPAPRSAPSSSGAENEEAAERRGHLMAMIGRRPSVHWNEIAGLRQAKQLLQEAVVLPLRLPHLFGTGAGQRKPWSAILMYGPPGTGKTQLANAVATESQAALFFSVSAADLLSKWVGESEKAIKDLFTLARQQKPSVIFIDEIDSLCGQRSDGGGGGGSESDSARRVKNQFLTETNDLQGILLLAATNLPWSLDTAFRRRFKKRIYIPLPDEEARKELLRIQLRDKMQRLDETDLERVATACDGFSGSDMSTLIDEAYMSPVRMLQAATHFRRNERGQWIACERADEVGAQAMRWEEIPEPEQIALPELALAHLLAARTCTAPTVAPGDLSRYETWTEEFGQTGTD